MPIWSESHICDWQRIYARKEYDNDKMFLIDTIKNEQDIYEKVCEELLDFDINPRSNDNEI